MAVTYYKNTYLENLQKQLREKVAEQRKLIFDPKNPKINGFKSAGYGALYVAGLGAFAYLTESNNLEFTLDYWKKAFGISENEKSIPISPTPKPDKVAGVNASNVNKMLNGLIEAQNKTTEGYNSVVESLNTLIENERVERLEESKQIVNQTQGQSPFLNNQIYLKNVLDDLVLSNKEQTGVLISICGILDLHLGAMAQLSGISVNTQLKEADAKIYETASLDYGDSNYFYQFVPTSEYWAKVDSATAMHYDSINVPLPADSYPSLIFAPREIELIDSLEGSSSRSEIRSKIEEFRKINVSSSIRALIGQVAVAQARDLADTNSKARDYYDSMKKWSDTAVVKEEFLTTPTTVKDLDGNVVAVDIAPIALTAVKEATIAREKTDTINFEVDDSDFPSLDTLPIIPFVGRESIFDLGTSVPSSNPFTHKNI